MLPPRTQGDFSLLVQRKVTKRKDTPDGAKPPAHPRLWGPRLTHATSCRGVWSRTSMSATPAGRFPKALRCLGAPYGDQKKPSHWSTPCQHYPLEIQHRAGAKPRRPSVTRSCPARAWGPEGSTPELQSQP